MIVVVFIEIVGEGRGGILIRERGGRGGAGGLYVHSVGFDIEKKRVVAFCAVTVFVEKDVKDFGEESGSKRLTGLFGTAKDGINEDADSVCARAFSPKEGGAFESRSATADVFEGDKGGEASKDFVKSFGYGSDVVVFEGASASVRGEVVGAVVGMGVGVGGLNEDFEGLKDVG